MTIISNSSDTLTFSNLTETTEPVSGDQILNLLIEKQEHHFTYGNKKDVATISTIDGIGNGFKENDNDDAIT